MRVKYAYPTSEKARFFGFSYMGCYYIEIKSEKQIAQPTLKELIQSAHDEGILELEIPTSFLLKLKDIIE